MPLDCDSIPFHGDLICPLAGCPEANWLVCLGRGGGSYLQEKCVWSLKDAGTTFFNNIMIFANISHSKGRRNCFNNKICPGIPSNHFFDGRLVISNHVACKDLESSSWNNQQERVSYYVPRVVVSNILYVHPYLGKIPILTYFFQMGWFNHQPVMNSGSLGKEKCVFREFMSRWYVWKPYGCFQK